MKLRPLALEVLCLADPAAKADAARALQARVAALPAEAVDVETAPRPDPAVALPGRPALPRLVPPAEVARRSAFDAEGRAALLHSIAHIEFNAINLAADCAWRFDGMPRDFHLDWVRIMAEEARHFSLLAELLQTMGWRYGDFPAHDGLWAMCERTAGDVVARLALVPRTLEARGLDATPQIQARLRRVESDDARRAVEILDVILRDEIGHVAAGNRWYRWACEQRGLDPLAQYRLLARRHGAPRLRPPFNLAARRAAGFSEEEIAHLGE